jgi:nanoRNase/pAp phosphatase (c-di-AMP/oligoRNAs hydrolase)
MPEKIGAEQIFALAERIERQGAEFYSEAVERVDDPSAAAVLRGLKQQELEHERTFKDLHDAVVAEILQDPQSESVVPDYLEAVVSGKLFDVSRQFAVRWRGNETLPEVLDTALGFEKEAIAFFVGLRPIAASAQGRAQIDLIIQEELRHIAQLSGLRSTRTFALETALESLGTGTCLILPHDNPDPDALAAALGLRDLLAAETALELTIGFGGIIGRAENRALVSLLGIPLTPIRPSDLLSFDRIALVDSQPGAGNTMVADGFPVDVVVDHHPRRSWSPPSPWTDVRQNEGSTASIVYTYLLERHAPISAELATALVYGIIADTMDLGRGATPLEYGAYVELLPLCNLSVLGRIRRPELPREHFRSLHSALEVALVYENRFVSVALTEMPFPDLPAEIADLLMRCQGVECSFCSGRYENGLRVSLRTIPGKADASALLMNAMNGMGTAGGHEHMAGGLIEIAADIDARGLGRSLADRLAHLLGLTEAPAHLVETGS